MTGFGAALLRSNNGVKMLYIHVGIGAIGIGKDQGVVRNAIGLGGERLRGLAEDIERGAHHLRLAAQAIGVLHARVVDGVAGADR